MKRHCLSLIVHPFKNSLIAKDKVRKYIDIFVKNLLEIIKTYPNFRINLVLPASLLQYIDPLLLSQLNEVRKLNSLEWLLPGYTEPFLSYSPPWLFAENLKYGIQTFSELIGYKPMGFVPACSNWDPSFIKIIQNNGIQYTVVSRSVLPANIQNYCGYWITEYAGNTMIVIPAHTFHHNKLPADIHSWIDQTVEQSFTDKAATQIVVLHYSFPLLPEKKKDPCKWLNAFGKALDTLLIKYQLNLLQELPAYIQPQGVHYMQPDFILNRTTGEIIPQCLNYLHTYDLVGIMHRKMMDISENIKTLENGKDLLLLKKQLFNIQDINRYLPETFSDIKERYRTFEQMIAAENQLLKSSKVRGGHIRIADFLKNGTKTIIMSNRRLKLYIDYKNGGQVFEMDYRVRNANLCAGYNPKTHQPPRILVPGKSRTCFIDHFLDLECQQADFSGSPAKQYGDFIDGQFDYKIKKVNTSVKAIMTRQGIITKNNKMYPVHMEKVFSIDKDKSELNFIYQLSNPSLMTYSFKFAIELTISLPGAQSRKAEIVCNKTTYKRPAWDRISLENVNELRLNDYMIGASIEFILQKPVTVWCYPVTQSAIYQGTTIVLSTPVPFGENAIWSLWGKIRFKKIRQKGTFEDVV